MMQSMQETIVELIHIATLVHDDVIDNANVRRNQATLHSITKANEAILVGDILFSHALEMASSFLIQWCVVK